MNAAPVRILYICPVGERGGAEVLLADLLRFHDRGAFAPRAVFLRDGPFADEVRSLGIEVDVIETGRVRHVVRTASTIRRLCRLIRANEVELVVSNMPLAHLYGGPAALVTKRKAVWFAYGTPAYWPATDWLASRLPTDGIFTCAIDVAKTFRTFVPARYRNIIHVFRMGVDLSTFDASSDGAPVRRELAIPLDAPVVGMVARFQRWKGQDYFVRAAAIVAEARPATRFLLVGDTMFGLEPEFKGELVHLVHSLGLAGSVIFAGFRDDLAPCLAATDIIVHGCVDHQPGGLIVIDAMAMGRPVIATDCGDRSEWMIPNETGVLIPPRNPERMAEAIISLIDNRALAARMGKAARTLVEERFSVRAMVADVERGFRDVLDGAVGGSL